MLRRGFGPGVPAAGRNRSSSNRTQQESEQGRCWFNEQGTGATHCVGQVRMLLGKTWLHVQAQLSISEEVYLR